MSKHISRSPNKIFFLVAFLITGSSIGCGSIVTSEQDSGDVASDVKLPYMPDGGAAGNTTYDGGASGTGGSSARGTGGSSAGGSGTIGTMPEARPLGAGCTDDGQCDSGICAKVNPSASSGTCCNGSPDACNTCVGGYKTPKQDNTLVGACIKCHSGAIVSVADGTVCSGGGIPTCDGSTGASAKACRAGSCMTYHDDCTGIFECPDGHRTTCPGSTTGSCGADSYVACLCLDADGKSIDPCKS